MACRAPGIRRRTQAGGVAAVRAGPGGLALARRELAGAGPESGVGGGRQQPMTRHASVRGTRLGIEAIHDGVVELTGAEFRGVLEVSGTARPFEDDARLEGVLAGYAAFLNGLSYPVQILVRASPVDLTRYIAALEERGRHLPDGQLADLAHDHALFVQGLARQRTLLERRFYVIVPTESTPRTSWLARFQPVHAAATEEPRRDAARRQLTFRCDDVARQLGRCGLAVRRLDDIELAELYLACWSPERARAQRFRQQLDEYTTLAVRTAAPAEREG